MVTRARGALAPLARWSLLQLPPQPPCCALLPGYLGRPAGLRGACLPWKTRASWPRPPPQNQPRVREPQSTDTPAASFRPTPGHSPCVGSSSNLGGLPPSPSPKACPAGRGGAAAHRAASCLIRSARGPAGLTAAADRACEGLPGGAWPPAPALAGPKTPPAATPFGGPTRDCHALPGRCTIEKSPSSGPRPESDPRPRAGRHQPGGMGQGSGGHHGRPSQGEATPRHWGQGEWPQACPPHLQASPVSSQSGRHLRLLATSRGVHSRF